MAYMDLTGIDCTEHPNHGGLRSLELIRVSDVSTLPAPIAGKYSSLNPETLVSRKSWTSYTFERFSGSLKVSPSQSPNGPSYQYELSLFMHKVEYELMHEINKLQRGHYLLKTLDYNQVRLLLGSLINPVRFTAAGEIATDKGGQNGFSWTLRWKTLYQAPVLGVSDLAGINHDIIEDTLIVY